MHAIEYFNSMASHPLAATAATYWRRTELSRRLALAREPQPEDARPPRAALLARELGFLAEPVRRWFDPWRPALARSPRTVMLVPGFGAHPARMRYMARQLEAAGHRVKRWGQGFNLGARAGTLDLIEARLGDIHARYGEAVHLVGWSLGGVFARELARAHPHRVSAVVSLGSPFSGDPRMNNVWRLYEWVAGHPVDHPPIPRICDKPPVPTLAIWSARDGIVAPRAARGLAHESDRAVELSCTHMAFGVSRRTAREVVREIDSFVKSVG